MLSVIVDGYTDEAADIIIFPSRHSYQIGDQPSCSADGNPPPTYQWKDLLTGHVINSSLLVVSKRSSRAAIFQCLATNEIYGEVVTGEKNISFTITDGQSELLFHHCFHIFNI